MNRKEELKKMDYGKLQRTREYKHYCDTYVNMLLMNEEVEYILKKSFEDSEAPFSYDDFEQFYYDVEEYKSDLETEITEDDDRTKE